MRQITVLGLDLAGIPKNGTGFCIMSDSDGKSVKTGIVHSDSSIIGLVESSKPMLVAVDAPLVYQGVPRDCDSLLAGYGVLPVTLSGMSVLAKRGVHMASSLSDMGTQAIEVSVKACAKLLGVYNKDDFSMQKNLMSLDISGDINRKIMSRDELDAIICAMTAYLHLGGSTKTVGDESGSIVIPDP